MSKRNSYVAMAVVIALIIVAMMAFKSGYTVGKDLALRDNARDAVTPKQLNELMTSTVIHFMFAAAPLAR